MNDAREPRVRIHGHPEAWNRSFMKSGIVVLFGVTSFLAAVLLFSVQPMIGKMVLPVLGGTPAVWNTCLVFFQVTLLAGYLLVHGIDPGQGAELRRVSAFFLVPFAAALALGYYVQPIVIQPGSSWWISGDDNPALALLTILSRSAFLPVVVVSAMAPLLQCWFALSGHPRARDPFFLYAASNAGSLLALLAYPFAVEPSLSLNVQSHVWRTGFLGLAILVLACGVVTRRLCRSRRVWGGIDDSNLAQNARSGQSHGGVETPPPLARRLRWIVLVFIPSSWLMGVTTYLTTDLASIPLFWTIPLALYLLSFVFAFASSGARVVRAATWMLPYLILALVLVMSAGFAHLAWIPLHLLTFFVGSLACHATLVQLRPMARHASAFYVTIAVGGLLGGIWSALLAPVLFSQVVEYPLAMVLAGLVVPGIRARRGEQSLKKWLGELLLPLVVYLLAAFLATNQAGISDSWLGVLGVMLASGLGALACVTAGRRPVRFALTVIAILAATGLARSTGGRLIYCKRSFFGVVRVTNDAERKVHRLFHGSTLHGEQSLKPALRREPTTYFTHSGPIGQIFEMLEPRLTQPVAQVAIVGLGAGTLASYARPGQKWTFYEIDPDVERIARDPRFFTYLQDCQAETVDVLEGDARFRLRDAPDHAFRLIVLDAFSSDAVPVHLLSREAIRLYREKLAEGGLLLFNLSNRYLDLDPVIGRQAEDSLLICRVRYDVYFGDAEKSAGKRPSIWAVLAATESDLGSLAADPRWRHPVQRAGSAVWTDDYSDVASYLLLTPAPLWKRGDRP